MPFHPSNATTTCLMNEGDRNKIRINCCSGGVSEQTQMQPQTDRRTDRHNLKLEDEQEEMLMRTRWLVAQSLYCIWCIAVLRWMHTPAETAAASSAASATTSGPGSNLCTNGRTPNNE